MSIVYPSNRQEVINRIQTDIQNELPDIDPFLRASIIRSLAVASGGRIFDIYKQLQQSQDELFVNTATQERFISEQGLLKGIAINAASQSTGFITITGSVSGIIDDGDLLESESSNEYEVINGPYVVSTNNINISTLSRSGATVTAVTNTDHLFSTSNNVTISGADQSEYNGTFTIISTGEKTFTYDITTTPTTPATGTIIAGLVSTSVEIESVNTGNDQNLESGAKLTFKTSISNVDDVNYVQFNKISGGEDLETIEEYRSNVLFGYGNPISNFNGSNIIQLAKTINGITRVWVFDAKPDAGQNETYHVRDNDDDIIPDSTELQELKTLLLTIKTSPMSSDDMFVLAPTPISINFVFSALNPDSNNMRNEIENNLQSYFKSGTNVSEAITEDDYRSVIKKTINIETGQFVKSFSLTSPIGDVNINHGEIGVFGSVSWSI